MYAVVDIETTGGNKKTGKIIEITDNKIFVAHNVAFDYNFIREKRTKPFFELNN